MTLYSCYSYCMYLYEVTKRWTILFSPAQGTSSAVLDLVVSLSHRINVVSTLKDLLNVCLSFPKFLM
jgi:hypothetical protein